MKRPKNNPYVKVQDGWAVASWIGYLRYKAEACGPFQVEIARRMLEAADYLEKEKEQPTKTS